MSWQIECIDCGNTFEAGTTQAKRCPDCRQENRKARRRVRHPDQTCTECGKTFTPYRGGQKTCGDNDCVYQNSRPFRGGSEERDAQLEKLFRYYKSRQSITIDEVPDGTRVLITSDYQLPFIDEAFEQAKQDFISDWKPGIIILAGDIVDAYELSEFDKRPERMFNLQDELQMAQDILRAYRRLSPGTQIYWIDGNHEERMQRTIWRRAQDFSFMVKDIPEAMELEKLTEGFVPYGKHIDLLGFIVTHGTVVRMHSSYTAKAMIDRYRSSGASGHTHRLGSHSVTDHRGVSHTWFELGCSCRKDLEYAKSHPNWQHGFLQGTVYNNAFHPELVRVIESGGRRSFVAGGKLYSFT